MIKCLPEELQGKLRSGVAVPSLQQCVEELILNSIDAGATCVGVRMDMDAFKVQVVDNGAGLSAEDMECVGNRYHTSKCESVEDLEDLRFYGFRGEALASIVSLATLVEISSRTKSSGKTLVKMFKDGEGLDVFEAETSRPSAGTTVIICNFFHNMPVRRKRMDAVLESERIRHRVEAISLMHPSVSFTLKNDHTGVMMVQLPKARNTYHRFVQIHNLGRAQKLAEINYTHQQFEVMGYIGRECHYNNSLQFLYVNDRLLLKTRIHKLLNFLLRRLSSSSHKNDSPNGQSATKSPKLKRSQEQYGVYIVNIKCPYSEYDICLEPAKTLIEFKEWDGVLHCIEEAVKAFLKRENLVSLISQDDMEEYSSPQLFGTNKTNQEDKSDQGLQTTAGTSKMDCSIGLTLASAAVHRKLNYIASVDSNEHDQLESKGDEELQLKIMTASELEISQHSSEESLSKECNEDEHELQFDTETATAEHACKVQVQNCIKAVESSHISFIEQVECKQLQTSEEREKNFTETTSTSHVRSSENITNDIQLDSNSIKQTLTSFHHTEGLKETSTTGKISLSHPYLHEALQTREQSHTNRPSFQQQYLSQMAEERSFSFKRKISIGTSKNKSSQNDYKGSAPLIPQKIPRVIHLCHETGSLDQFRRIYGKSDKLQLPSQGTHSQNSPRLPERDSNLLGCQKNPQDCDTSDIKEDKRQSSDKCAPDFTKLKPVAERSRGKKSLAAKLCYLKQQKRRGSCETTLIPSTSTTSETSSSVGSSLDCVQGSNNNENPCIAAVYAEPASAGTTYHLAETEQDTAPGDWLHHYDASVGKTVYVNKVTGLSSYGDPVVEETRAPCTADVTNMAVGVITEMGLEYRCYPFQVDLVLPFLPKSRTDRVCSSGLDDRTTSQGDQIDYGESGESSSSLSLMYSKWSNPVFVRPPTVGVDISSGQADGLVVKIHNILFPYRFSKAMINSMKVIHQVDKKFLACLINTREEEPVDHNETEGNLLVLVDQHAAHERVRLEHLIADSYEDDPHAPGERRLCSSTISPPLEISVVEEELRLLRSCQPHLRSVGLEVTFSQASEPQVLVGKVPLCFMEKESNERRRGRRSIIKPIIEEYLQEQIELLRSAGRVRGTLPLTVLKVLASLACHGAVKFNDSLSKDECCSLVASLSGCQLPFQCAHGRPSIAPLVDILHLENDEKELHKPNLQKLRRMYKAWALFGNR